MDCFAYMEQIKAQNNQNAQISTSAAAAAASALNAAGPSGGSTQSASPTFAAATATASTAGPSEEAIRQLCERTGFEVVQENGQRRFGPPPKWEGPPPNRGCEVFVGKIPRDCFEDELVPVFESVGPIFMFRLMMEFSATNEVANTNRGYGFCVYTNREDTKRAVRALDNYEIRKGKLLGVCLSVDNCRLFVGGIPKNKTKQDILAEMRRVTDGVVNVIVYPSATNKDKNRGFAFVEYEHHKAAAMARRKLIPGRIQLWDQQIAVDWAEPEREVDEDVMAKVRILYVRNLMLDTTEEHLREVFTNAAGVPDCVERVKKIRDYAFVHFKEREQALEAMDRLNETQIDGSRVEVSLAKPAEKTDSGSGGPGRQSRLVNGSGGGVSGGLIGGGIVGNGIPARSMTAGGGIGVVGGFNIIGGGGVGGLQQLTLPTVPHSSTGGVGVGGGGGGGLPLAYNLIGGQPTGAGLEPLALAYCSQLLAAGHAGATTAAMSPRLIATQPTPNGIYLTGGPDSPKLPAFSFGGGFNNGSGVSGGGSGGAPAGRRILRNAAGTRSAGARNHSNNNTGMQQQYHSHQHQQQQQQQQQLQQQQHQMQQQQRIKRGNVDLLDELCARNGLGSPSYQVQSQELLEPATGAQSSWFLGRVTLSGSHGGAIPPRQFSAFRFTQTTDEARSAAAEAALMQLYQLPAAGGIGSLGTFAGLGGGLAAFPADPSQAAFLAAGPPAVSSAAFDWASAASSCSSTSSSSMSSAAQCEFLPLTLQAVPACDQLCITARPVLQQQQQQQRLQQQFCCCNNQFCDAAAQFNSGLQFAAAPSAMIQHQQQQQQHHHQHGADTLTSYPTLVYTSAAAAAVAASVAGQHHHQQPPLVSVANPTVRGGSSSSGGSAGGGGGSGAVPSVSESFAIYQN